ncbi:hypothetical protein LINPERHAP1_LOCUS20782 [Linum perenne]
MGVLDQKKKKKKKLFRTNPRCLYIGDHRLQCPESASLCTDLTELCC